MRRLFHRAMAVEQMALQTAIRLGAVFGPMLLPLFALVGLAILLDSGWPVFYRGERVGRHGRSFAVTDYADWMARASS
ncbi:MAG TPA: sugar transferase [Methylomirabilota bacterium]|nr:sugar transferase [Methylomirabilota bacterium]